MKQLNQVNEFMTAMGQHMPDAPEIPPGKIVELRQTLIEEENGELSDAAEDNDIVEAADALCDLLYVVLGAFTSYGFKPELVEELFDEVQASNMSKLCQTLEEAEETVEAYTLEGVTTYTKAVGDFFAVTRLSDDKVLKSINYKAPNLRAILEREGVLCQ